MYSAADQHQLRLTDARSPLPSDAIAGDGKAVAVRRSRPITARIDRKSYNLAGMFVVVFACPRCGRQHDRLIHGHRLRRAFSTLVFCDGSYRRRRFKLRVPRAELGGLRVRFRKAVA